MAQLPYGDAYLIAFGVKMLLGLALVLGTAILAFQLRRAAAAINLAVGGVLLSPFWSSDTCTC